MITQYTVISYVIWEQSNCWPKVEGIVFLNVARGHRPGATVQNTIPDNKRQLSDCCNIPYKITVLLPDQLKERKKSIAFANMLIIKLFSFTIMTSKCVRETVETIDWSTVQR